uniref:Spherules-specific protein n=1 Tax=Physarum polycephalum TaxID=5791 RepID=Q4U3C8_PHYPO|nr:spherules-specific protein [Physarum polycephalum]
MLRVGCLARSIVLTRGVTRRHFSSAPPEQQWEHILDRLVCPLDKAALRAHRDDSGKLIELVNDRIGVAYPIIRGVPHLTPADARALNPAAQQSMKAAQKGEEGSRPVGLQTSRTILHSQKRSFGEKARNFLKEHEYLEVLSLPRIRFRKACASSSIIGARSGEKEKEKEKRR